MTTARPRPPGWLLLLAELLLGATTVSVVFGFGRVFAGSDFAPPMLVVAIGTHVLVALLRRAGLGVGWSMLATAGFAVIATSLALFGDTTRFLLPSGATVDAALDALTGGVEAFQQVVAPAPADPGFVLAASLALVVAVFLADWAAFRLWSGIEAVIPAFTLFVFCSLLGAAQHQVVSALAFSATALGFLVVHRTAKRTTGARWIAQDTETGTWTIVRSGLAFVVVAVVVGGAILGVRLPGADAGALVSWRDRGDTPGDRFTVSPLVEINTRLVDQADVELFTVRADAPAYWRLTSLETFDGSSWRSKGRFTDAGADLGSPPPGVATTALEQSYEIERLSGLWLPVAMIPTGLGGDVEARFHDDSSTLIVDSNVTNSDGYRYDARSAVPSFDSAELRRASAAVPEEIAERYLGLPPNFSPTAVAQVEEVTAGLTTPYDQARALQDWFHANFTYNLDVGPGHGDDAIERFLASREGYCEQFAGTFAAMARHLGIPARVAVGFTQGEVDPDDPSLYRVKGLHAHAWPEVWLGEHGWVPFEPTPSRGAPGAEAWTGLAPSQGSDADLSTAATPTTIAPPTTAAPGEGVTPTTAARPQAGQDPTLGTGAGMDPDEPDAGWVSALRMVLFGALAVVVLLGVWILALRFLDARLRSGPGTKRAGRTGEPDERVRRAWSEALDHLELIGTRPRPSETHSEFAARSSGSLGGAGTVLVEMARTTDLATFAPTYVDDELALDTERAAREVEEQINEQLEPTQRARSLLDPRPVWRAYQRRPAD